MRWYTKGSRVCNIPQSRFATEERNVDQALGRSVCPKSIVAEMLNFKENWLTVSFATVKIQNELLKLERET